MSLRNQVQLICYPERIGSGLADLADFLESRLADTIGGVHLLPVFVANGDGGFAPLTHFEVNPAFGDWADVERISRYLDLCLDLILDHISDKSPEFQDYLERGFESPHADLFIHVEKLGEFSQDDMAHSHIRKEKEPFREIRCANGDVSRVWCPSPTTRFHPAPVSRQSAQRGRHLPADLYL